MLKTIELGSCVQVQGIFVRKSTSGRIVIRVDGRLFEGLPVGASALR